MAPTSMKIYVEFFKEDTARGNHGSHFNEDPHGVLQGGQGWRGYGTATKIRSTSHGHLYVMRLQDPGIRASPRPWQSGWRLCAMVYPVDLVKTRMQNQRSAAVGQQLYNNTFGFFCKVLEPSYIL